MTDAQPDLERLLRRARVTAFDAGFADRVLQRWHADARRSLGRRLQRPFQWMLPAAIAALLVLAFLNVRAMHARSGNPFDAVLGLQRVTLQSAYALDTEP